MIVYADILIILNLAVDYILLRAAAFLQHLNPPLWRMLLSSLAGGISSLYIFLPPQGAVLDILFRTAVCAAMTFICFGFGKIKRFLRSFGVFLLVTFGYGGAMTALWYLLKPSGMTVINSVVYFNISPAVLIFSSVAAYFLLRLLSLIFSGTSKLAERCEITVSAGSNSITMEGIVDTGNSVEDIFGGGEVIIADGEYVKTLFGETDPALNKEIQSRYRVMPCGTVTGGGTLEAFRCDTALVSDGKRNVRLNKPILAISKTPLKDDYSAIVNPRIFM